MKARVLVVDDNPVNLKLAVEILEAEEYDVEKASDAEEAQLRLKHRLPDLILMDIELPGMDGLTLTKLLKSDKRTHTICIVALTAFAMKGDEKKASDAGCDGYITKPVDTRTLAITVAQILEQSRYRLSTGGGIR